MSASEFSALLRQRILLNNTKDLQAYSVKNSELKLKHDWNGNTPDDDVATDNLELEAKLEQFVTYLNKLVTLNVSTPIIASARKDLSNPSALVDINIYADDLNSQTQAIIDSVRLVNSQLYEVTKKSYVKSTSDMIEIQAGLKYLENSLVNKFGTTGNVEQIILNSIKDMDSEEFLLNFKSSKSIIQKLEETIESILLNKAQVDDTSFTGNLNVGRVSVNIKTELKKAITALKKAKDKISKANKRARDSKGRFFSVINLKELINKKLHDQIKKNMGKGNAKTILNYRSGRFASSAYVKDVALTREETINIFYSYMKYPYATFAKGGRQENPSTRNPELLIAKSIREIAKEVVTNKLKAVPV